MFHAARVSACRVAGVAHGRQEWQQLPVAALIFIIVDQLERRGQVRRKGWGSKQRNCANDDNPHEILLWLRLPFLQVSHPIFEIAYPEYEVQRQRPYHYIVRDEVVSGGSYYDANEPGDDGLNHVDLHVLMYHVGVVVSSDVSKLYYSG